ncbi:substrate-binding domain-containing protein [Nocardioides cavernae]|uniref:Substrate-binding domain-containing protein n=1 Tax=Nocardioides cavernae TaxID=1921566 RepID=A0ABR8NDJ7_9ACTN|nr:substrate-binding domain-containing protein [Nocardioides cavernae]MBD3926186.1 substrate-binding domain-containing protein [Nocardioides cavernae]MBM7513778.1 ribose transport system substrate-binding protein [Nocardioides cavernae]
MRPTRTTLAALAAGALLLTGCSSVEDQAAADQTDRTEATSPEATAALEKVRAASEPVAAFEAPGDPITGVDALEGSTVYYVPANGQVPLFQAIRGSLEQALGAAGVKVEVCDGKANPGNMASCIQQGVDASAAAIVTGSIDEVLVANAYKSAQRAGVPVVNLMTIPGSDADQTAVAYLTPDFVKLQSLAADWVIADSDAKAEVLVVQVTDTPVTNMWAEQGILAEYETACPSCEVTVVKANTGQFDKLGSLVTSELTKNPDIGYVQTEFDSAVQPTVQGLQGANATDVTISSHDGTLGVLQMLESGQTVGSNVGLNADALAWYAADQALRLMVGQPANQMVDFPYVRMFNADNVGDLDLTPDAERTGAWYGSTDYQDGFTELWGLS